MSNCLIDYVGIRVCEDQDDSGSAVYINSLPGISLESIDKTANEDQLTYAGLWTDVQAEAWEILKLDFTEQLDECFDINCEFDVEDVICTNKKKLLNAWRYLLGNQLMIFRTSTTRLNRFTTLDAEQAQKLADYYQVKYEKAVYQAARLIDMSFWTRELRSDPMPKQVIWHP
jgi:hypothetical protein